MSCPFEIDVVRWVTGDTRLNELARVEEHVAGCATCRTKAESLRAMLSRIAEAPVGTQDNESSPKVFVDSVMERIGRESSIPSRRRTRRPLAFAAGLALPLLLLGAFTIHRMGQSGDAPPPGAQRVSTFESALFVERDGKSEPAESVLLRPSDGLVVRYDNPAPTARYFVALTLDAEGNAQWFQPSEREWQAKPGPIALRRESSGQLAGDLGSLEAAHGLLRVIALSSDDPKGLDGARAALQGRSAQVPVGELFGNVAVREWLLKFDDPPQEPRR